MIIAALVIFGLCFGSFINALVWRVYEQSKPKKRRAAKDENLSIATGRSMCTHCKHTLAWYDLLPVLSWLSLGGKCRYCRKPISWQYPTVELLTAILFVVSYIFWPTPITYNLIPITLFSLWLVALVMLVALAVYDIRWMLLPNRMVFPLTGVAAVYAVLLVVLSGQVTLYSVVSPLLSLLIAGGIFYLLFQVSDGKWIGGGDVKLGLALGLLLGTPIMAFMMLFAASLLGILFALPGLILRKTELSNKIPFGPFLIAATIIVMLFGGSVWAWYSIQLLGL